MQSWLLEIIRCPISGQSLQLADDSLVARLRQQQTAQTLHSHKGIAVAAPFDAGLVNQSQTYFYRMCDNIPALLPDEAISIANP